jgi:hypothetical protein
MIEHATTKAVTDTGASGVSADHIPTFANDDFDADSPAGCPCSLRPERSRHPSLKNNRPCYQ